MKSVRSNKYFCFFYFIILIYFCSCKIFANNFLKVTSDRIAESGSMALSVRSLYLRKASAFDYQSPADSLINGPTLNALIGFGTRADFEINWDTYRWMNVDQTYYSDVSDVSFFTKIKLISENIYPSLNIKIGAKLPNASDENRVGTDLADTFISFIAGKQMGSFHIFSNAGIDILGDLQGGQNDAFAYGLACIYPFSKDLKGLIEWSGRYFQKNHLINQSSIRTGISYQKLYWQFDMGISKGLIAQSETWGIAGGVTKTFQLF